MMNTAGAVALGSRGESDLTTPTGPPISDGRYPEVEMEVEHEHGDGEGAPLRAEKYQKLVNYYRERDAQYVSYRELVNRRYWPDKYYKSDDGANVEGMLDPSLIYQVMHNSEARMLGSPPQFLMKGWTAQIDKAQVPALETGLNNEWEHDRDTFSQLALGYRVAFKHGFALFKTTYDAEIEADAVAASGRKDAQRRAAAANPVMALMAEDLSKEAAAQAQVLPTPTTKLTYEMTSLVRTDSINTRLVTNPMFDPDASTPEAWQWVGQTMYVRLDALRHDARMDQSVVDAIADRTTDCDGTLPYRIVEIHELFCLEFDEDDGRAKWHRVTFAEGAEFCLEHRWSPMWIGHPYSYMAWNTTGENSFAMPQPLVFEDMYRAQAGLLTKIINGHNASRQNTTFVDKRALAEQDMAPLKKGEPPRFVMLDPQGDHTLRDCLYEPPPRPESGEALNTYSILRSELERGMGMGANQQLQAMKSDTSAREAAEVAMNAAMAMSHVERAVESCVLSISKKRFGLMGQFYDKARMMRIAGSEAAQAWPDVGTPFTEGDVQGGMGIHIQRGSMRPRNDAADFQNVLLLFQAFQANPYTAINTDWIYLQRTMARLALGVRGEALLVEPNVAKAMEMIQAMQATQMAQGQVPDGGQRQGSIARQ